MSKSLYPPVVDRSSSSLVDIDRHGRYYHLHFDIHSPIEVSHRLLEPFVRRQSASMAWSDFVRPTQAEILSTFQSSKKIHHDIVARLCDPYRSGAPMSHLSAKKQLLPAASAEAQSMWNQFREGVAAMQSVGLCGYVELEELSCRHVLTPPSLSDVVHECLPRLPFLEFDRVPLSDASVGRQFRTTEVHCTFEDLCRTDLCVLDELIRAGFYTAFLRRSDGSLKLILTIQGFEPDIGLVYGLLLGWISKCQSVGRIGGTVTLKKEDIAGYAILGDRDEAGLQMVVRPMSVVESLMLMCEQSSALECALS